LVAMQEFDRIFDGDDVFGTKRVHAIDHRRQGGRFSGTGDTGYENESASLVANFLNDFGEIEFVKNTDLGRNHTQDQADIAALLEDVHTEASQTGNAIGHIKFGRLFEFLLLTIGHHAEGHVQHVLRSRARLLAQRHEFSVDANVRKVANL